jgi:hypothetical protein
MMIMLLFTAEITCSFKNQIGPGNCGHGATGPQSNVGEVCSAHSYTITRMKELYTQYNGGRPVLSV